MQLKRGERRDAWPAPPHTPQRPPITHWRPGRAVLRSGRDSLAAAVTPSEPLTRRAAGPAPPAVAAVAHMRDQHALHLTRRQLAQAYSRRRSCNASEASCGRGCGISCEIADVKLGTYTGLSGTSVWQGNIDQLTPGIAYEVNVAEALSFSATGHLVRSVHKCHGRRQGAGRRGAWARPIRLAYYTPPGPPVMWVGGARLWG